MFVPNLKNFCQGVLEKCGSWTDAAKTVCLWPQLSPHGGRKTLSDEATLCHWVDVSSFPALLFPTQQGTIWLTQRHPIKLPNRRLCCTFWSRTCSAVANTKNQACVGSTAERRTPTWGWTLLRSCQLLIFSPHSVGGLGISSLEETLRE